jgi:hypothetical protein
MLPLFTYPCGYKDNANKNNKVNQFAAPILFYWQGCLIPDSNRVAYISYKLLAASCKQKYKENLSKVYNAS